MSVTVPGLSGLTNAYTSVLSATGSLAISGASRCEDTRLPHRLETGSNRLGSGSRMVRTGRRACLQLPGGSGSADRPGDPGGEVLVAQPGLAGPGEYLDVSRPGIAHVHHDRPGGRVVVVRLVRSRRAGGGGGGEGGRCRAHGRDGEPGGAGGRGALQQGTPGQACVLRILTGHDDPFGDWPSGG